VEHQSFSETPEGKTLVKMFTDYKVDIAMQSELRFVDSGCMQEQSDHAVYFHMKSTTGSGCSNGNTEKRHNTFLISFAARFGML
jgi:hypothetical protein